MTAPGNSRHSRREGSQYYGLFDQPDPDDDYFAQSTTACCPRQTIPDSCSCPDDCECLCADCICGREDWDEICRCTGICTCEVAW